MAWHRVGLIVPSSNVTVESEIPAILGRQPGAEFSFHSSRARATAVSAAGLAAMQVQRDRCVMELADAGPDVILYACLDALVGGNLGEHHRVESLVAEQLATGESRAMIRSSAGALLEVCTALSARRVALVTSYMSPFAAKIVSYIEDEGVDVSDFRALEADDSRASGSIEESDVMEAARSLDLTGVDALVLACVQMPSLSLIPAVEQELGIPVFSAATAAAYSILRALKLPAAVGGAGSILESGLELHRVIDAHDTTTLEESA